MTPITCPITWDKLVAHGVKPGMVLTMADGRVLLVGHINILGGTCDDCSEFRGGDDTIVAIRQIEWEAA